MKASRHLSCVPAVMFCLALSVCATFAQIPENRQDPNGIAIPYAFSHLVHTTDLQQAGGTAYLRAFDPFLFYQLGRDLVQRQFLPSQGAYGRSGQLSVPLYAAMTVGTDRSLARFARDHTNSCGVCHSIPYREPGAGQTIASTAGTGRNTTHFYGAGLIEMLGAQIRQEILNSYDTNKNGVFDRNEVAKSCPVRIQPATGEQPVDYGDLQPGRDGVPQLNAGFRCWYLDQAGYVIADAEGMNDARVAAFDIAMQPFGWGRGYRLIDNRKVAEGGEASTLRGFFTTAADVHMGLQAFDSLQQIAGAKPDLKRPSVGGLAGVSNDGAQQFDFGGSTDLGLKTTTTGLSLDDPDGDGYVEELTEGDVDAAEFYMLNAPAPGILATKQSEQGRQVLFQLGCTRCHVENWTIQPRNAVKGFVGDRRLFSLTTKATLNRQGEPELSGTLVPLYSRHRDGSMTPRYGTARVDRVYSDFKQWDLGPRFFERRYDGELQREHRTAPLWGIASTAPYGHGGQFLTLDEVIRAHDGEAIKERNAYVSLSQGNKQLLLQYLKSLVLYSTADMPADINGDGVISNDYQVAGQALGFERFDPRFLFQVPPQYRIFRPVSDAMGRLVPLAYITNTTQTYRLDLPYRLDADEDSFPDVIDPLPFQKGVR